MTTHELIRQLHYARYFLTVHDVVAFARPGKGNPLPGPRLGGNSAVCYCLGITSVNPEKSNLLFARFVSENRDEPPDIDVHLCRVCVDHATRASVGSQR